MSTSGGGTVNAVLYLVAIVASLRAVTPVLDGTIRTLLRRPSKAAVVGWLVVAVPSLLQIPFPGIYSALRRDPHRIRHHGQV